MLKDRLTCPIRIDRIRPVGLFVRQGSLLFPGPLGSLGKSGTRTALGRLNEGMCQKTRTSQPAAHGRKSHKEPGQGVGWVGLQVAETAGDKVLVSLNESMDFDSFGTILVAKKVWFLIWPLGSDGLVR